MTDIVERLRQMPSSLNDACRRMDQAAAEIERLRKLCDSAGDEMERLRSELEIAHVPSISVDALAELERLRSHENKLLSKILEEVHVLHEHIRKLTT